MPVAGEIIIEIKMPDGVKASVTDKLVKIEDSNKKYDSERVYTEVEELSLGLITLGFQKGDMACLIGDNRPEYWIGQMAVMSIGGIPVGIFQDSLKEEIEF